MHLPKTLKDNLTMANLYFLLAKRYEYADPQKHIMFYQKHLQYVVLVEQEFMKMEGNINKPYQYPMY